MPDTRGDVLCPTCGQWTPPAPFCTECGAVLQVGFEDGSAQSGQGAFRRGHEVAQPGSPWSTSAERFEPEPEDQAARAAAASAAAAAGTARIDHLAEAGPPAAEPQWPPEPGLPPETTPPATEEPVTPPAAPPRRRSRAKATEAAAAAAVTAAAGAAMTDPVAAPIEPPGPPPAEAAPPPPMPPPPPPVAYAGPPSDGGSDGNSGITGLVFVVFLGLGILALLGGAILGGVFDGPVAEASATPSPVVATPTPESSEAGTPVASVASLAPTPSPAPTSTPPPGNEDFLARAEPCEDQPSGTTCDSSGAINNGDVWILVSFRHGKPDDVIGITVLDSGGGVRGTSSLGLAFCDTNTDCAGWTYDDFSGLPDGDYDVRVTHNGAPVTTTDFTVE